jgi:predicted RNase H-like HicB family nuclease
MPIRQHFVNPDKEFEHECYWEEVFVSTLEDVVLFGKTLQELIAAARELQFHGG